MMSDYQVSENEIDKDIITKWRRDIVKITPVFKIGSVSLVY